MLCCEFVANWASSLNVERLPYGWQGLPVAVVCRQTKSLKLAGAAIRMVG